MIVNERNLPGIEDARAIAGELVGECNGFTIGQIARQLVKWLGPPDRTSTAAARATLSGCWSFKFCSPALLEYGTMFDIDSCFYTILSRVPTIRPVFTSKGLIWTDSLTATEADRFRLLLRAVSPHKLLRNAIIGAMTGDAKSHYFAKGKRHDFRTEKGPRLELGAAVVRTAYELAMLQASASGALYANTDAVIVPGSDTPKVWEAARLPYRCLGHGVTDIQGFGNYRCGTHWTKSYKPGSELPPIELDEPEPVQPIYHPWIYA